MKIEKFDKNVFKTLRPEIQAALDTIKDKFGVTIKLGNINFTGNEFTGKIIATF